MFLEEVSPCVTNRKFPWSHQILEGSEKIHSLLKPKLSGESPDVKIEGPILSLSNIKKKLEKRRGLHTVMIFCSNTIFLDSDLELQETNLAIIAPFWRIESPVTLNLSGRDGENIKDQDGIHGRPGGPGGNGGSFIGRASEVSDISKLSINVKGGNGGNGSNGANGENGKIGYNGDKWRVKRRDKSFLVEERKATFSEGKIEFILEGVSNFQ